MAGEHTCHVWMPLAVEMVVEMGAIEAPNLRTVEASQAAPAGTGN
jgi:hypothetical protein